MQHLELKDLIDYPSEDMENNKRIEDHLKACPECQERYQRVQKVQMLLLKSAEKISEGTAISRSSDCLDYQEIAEYVEIVLLKQGDFVLPEADIETMTRHLEECDRCLNIVLATYQMLFDIEIEDAKLSEIMGKRNVEEGQLAEQKKLAKQAQDIMEKAYILIAIYMLTRPYVKNRRRTAPKNRLVNENDKFRWEIYQERNRLIFSLVEKTDKYTEKYVAISIKSAGNVERSSDIIQWQLDGPEHILSENPISSDGRVEFLIAETRLDMENSEDFDILERIFEELELKIFDLK